MNKKTFLYIFAGVVAAGILCLVIGLIVHYAVSANAIVTIVSLFAMIAGGIMAGIGLIALLICLLLIVFAKGNKQQQTVEEVSTDTATDTADGTIVAEESESELAEEKADANQE